MRFLGKREGGKGVLGLVHRRARGERGGRKELGGWFCLVWFQVWFLGAREGGSDNNDTGGCCRFIWERTLLPWEGVTTIILPNCSVEIIIFYSSKKNFHTTIRKYKSLHNVKIHDKRQFLSKAIVAGLSNFPVYQGDLVSMSMAVVLAIIWCNWFLFKCRENRLLR